MACPCCGLCSKLDTLEGNIVDLYSRSSKSNHSIGLSRRVKDTREAERLQDSDAHAQKRLICSLPSRSHRGGLSAVRRLQQKTSNDPSVNRNVALPSKISANPKHRKHRTLAFVLHDEDFTNESLRTKISSDHSDKLTPFPLKSVEMQAFHTAASHASSLPYTGITPDNMNRSYARLHTTEDFANGTVSDLDDSEESEREVEGAICLSSFKFGSTKYLPPSLELIANGNKSLVRKLSSESCISMLSLDCKDDQLSGDDSVESFPSGDSSLQAEMTAFSVCFPDSRANINNEANIVKPYCQFGGSGSIGLDWKPNLEMQSEAANFSGLSLPPLGKLISTLKGQQQKDLRFETCNKKRLRSTTHKTRRLINDKTRKASLNLRPCRGLAGLISGGTDIYRAVNLGVGIGVAYMLFANWNELKKLNFLLQRTEALVKDINEQAPSRASPLLRRVSPLEASNFREPENNVEAAQPESLKTDGANELILKSRNMAELEAALEAELALMQRNLEAEVQVSPGGFDKCNLNDHPRTEKYSTGSPLNGSTKNATNLHHAVSPNTLNKRLHEVIEVQQEETILHLEAQVEARELDLLLKEKELQCWKDIAHHLVNALPASKGRKPFHPGGLCLAGEDSRGQQGLSSAKHHARHHLLPDRCKDFKMSGCRTANRRRVLDYEPPARSDSFCESFNDNLIDPSFEALTLRNSLDWSIGVQSAEAESRKEDSTLSSDGGQDVCDLFKDLDADKMFPWLLHDEECLPEAPHFGVSSPFIISSLQGHFAENESCCLNGAKR